MQGAVSADGAGNLLSGLTGTVPNATYSTSIAVTELTGVGARSVGVAIGAIFVAVAFLPKALAVVLAIPGPVAAAYITVLLAMLFVTGMKMVVQDGIDYRNGLVVGISFWAGVGFQSGVVFPEYFSQVAGGLLQNGMTAGGLVAILMTLFMELTAPRRRRIEVETDLSDLPKIREFLGPFASRNGGDTAMAERLDAAGEPREQRRLLLVAHKQDGGAVLEFVASTGPREPAGPDRAARPAFGGGPGRARDIAPAPAPHRHVGSPRAVPRHGNRDRARGRAAAGPLRATPSGEA